MELRKVVRFVARLIFRFGAFNETVLNTPGPVLLVPNHVSWLDWLFVYVCLDDDWKIVTSSTTAQISWLHRRMMLNRLTFPVDTTSPFAVKRIAEFLKGGGRLVLFAEGRISMTGALMKLYEGTGFLLHKTDAKVITCYLRGANRFRFVRHSGWTRWFPQITVHFGERQSPPKLPDLSSMMARRRLTGWLYDQMVRQQVEVEMEQGPKTVLGAVAETASKRPRDVVLEDVTLQQLTNRKFMTGVRVLAGQWRRILGDLPGERVGMLLPNVNATPVVLFSLWMVHKIPAVLNYSSGMPTMLACVRLAGLKRIITSRLFLEKARIDPAPFREAGLELICLEDVRAAITPGQKLGCAFEQIVRPHAGAPPDQSETAVILFTSGSEGTPKGVELTHTNLMSNIRQILCVIDVVDADRMFNALPLFHSFGLSVGLLLPLVRGLYTFLYPSPLHYRMVPSVIYDRACTLMLGTTTFLNGYARKAGPYDFRSVRLLFAGAEKLQENTANAWARQYGVRILEGYGATECSPVIAVNTPLNPGFGSAGRFLPGIEHRLEPVEGVSEGGRLHVRGPNIMRGYLNDEANAQFQALGGWYDTGDIVTVDADGFVTIRGRLKRFAKISGEMVSLTAVEEALAGAFPHFGLRCEVAVLSQPDEDKGERLIAVTNESRLQLEEIRAVLRARGLPNLSVPREVRFTREIPKLGSGKVNHRELESRIAD
jgi:acyl-[acyl-carrier-protein]-phospholipid O-acyltransferase / long-chain-fatty-acid--[acyl-carrier-protein] ligase